METACSECNTVYVPSIRKSARGFYVGSVCECGVGHRDSGYFPTAEAAQVEWDTDAFTQAIVARRYPSYKSSAK